MPTTTQILTLTQIVQQCRQSQHSTYHLNHNLTDLSFSATDTNLLVASANSVNLLNQLEKFNTNCLEL